MVEVPRTGVWLHIRKITVEPGVFLLAVGHTMYVATMRQAVYNKICSNVGASYFGGGYVPDCNTPEIYPDDFTTYVDEKYAAFNRINIVASVVTPSISSLLLSAWGDLAGRKINMLIATLGVILLTLSTLIVSAIPGCSIWVLLCTNFVFGCMGQFSLFMTSAVQHIADITEDKRKLAVRMTFIVAIMGLSVLVGSLSAGFMVGKYHYAYTLMTGMVFQFASFWYALAFLDQVPPAVRMRSQHLMSDMSVETFGSYPSQPAKKRGAFMNILVFIGGLVRDIWTTFTKQRHERKRFWLFSFIVSYFFLGMGKEGLQTVMVSYMKDPPFRLSDSQYITLTAANGAAAVAGSAVGVVVFKRFRIRDTTILMISLLSTIGQSLVQCFVQTYGQLFIAAAAGCLGFLGFGVFQSFVAQLVSPEEVGKVLAAESIVISIANAVGNIIINSVYKQFKERHYIREGFIVVAIGFSLVSLFITLGVHVGTRKILSKGSLKRPKPRPIEPIEDTNSSNSARENGDINPANGYAMDDASMKF